MARPTKAPADKRDRKIVIWMSPTEQARYLVNAARTGLTGPDYIRAIAAGSPVPASRRGDRQLILSLDAGRQRALDAAAGRQAMALEAFLLQLIDGHLAHRRAAGDPVASFELIDALSRIGVSLNRLVSITEMADLLPDEITPLLARLDRLLDRLLPP